MLTSSLAKPNSSSKAVFFSKDTRNLSRTYYAMRKENRKKKMKKTIVDALKLNDDDDYMRELD